VHDGDGARGVVQNALADRTEQRRDAGVPGVASDDEQLLCCRLRDQAGDRELANDTAPDIDVRILLLPAGDGLG
jgi:hypothetical protein